ncbi:Uncharacterised protein [uncultured archaeon]|nr:Uncharacterised protein [uncultured archaeon]
MPVPLSPSIQRPAPTFAYPTLFTNRPVSEHRQRLFQRFLEMPTKGSFIENHAAMLRSLRAAVRKCPPETAKAALACIDYFERIYPLEKLADDGTLKPNARKDGTLERCHPLAIAWWLAYAGAPADVVVACLYHDAVEDGMLASLEQWSRGTGLALDSPGGAFLQSAWGKIETLTRPPVVREGKNLNNELHELLRSPADFSNPRVKEILSILSAEQDNYVTRIYQTSGSNPAESEGLMTAIIKVFDTLYNTRSLVYLQLDGEGMAKNFSRYYNTLRKAFSHLEPLKKLNHELAKQILISIGRGLERLAAAGVGPAEIPQIYQLYWYHVTQQSGYQRSVEHRGFADCGLRSVFNPDKNTYARSAISKFGPESKGARRLVDTPAHPAQPMEFEVPLYVRNEPWWHFFENTFRPLDLDKLQKAIAKAFPSKRFTLYQQPSYLPPLLGEFLIWRFEPPLEVKEAVRKLSGLPAGAFKFAELRSAELMREYERFDKEVRRGLRYIYKKVVRGPAYLHYPRVALMLGHQWVNRLFGIREPHTSTALPDETYERAP